MTTIYRSITVIKVIATVSLCPLIAQVNVTTQHNDNMRTGQNTSESTLNLSNVNATDFGLLAVMAVDDQVYAQPLVLTNIQIGGGIHSVVYIATENNSVYAFDANTGVQYWHTNFGNPVSVSQVNCNDIDPNGVYSHYGITSTPAIDPTSSTIYLVTNTYENGIYYYRLHALNTLTGAEKPGSPVVVQTPTGTLDARMENQRTALLLTNGHVIFGLSSHCDNGPFYGYVFSYKASTLARENVFTPVPSGDGGVWMGGDGLAVDANGYIYFSTGNGEFNPSGPWGDSILKLPEPPLYPTAWNPVDSYTPGDQSYVNANDLDLGSGGVVLLPNLPPNTPHNQRLAQAGKQGIISIVDRNAMGGYCCVTGGSTPHDTNIVEEIEGQIPTGVWGSPAYWNGHIYFGGNSGSVKSFSFNLSTGSVSTSPVASSSSGCGSNESSHYSCSFSLSSSGTSNGILWYQDSSTGILHALNATTLAEIYNSDQTARDHYTYYGAKFAAPTIANAKVYVGAASNVGIFGENPSSVYWSGSANGLNCNSNGAASLYVAQNGANSLSWNFHSSDGPKDVYSISWTLSDSQGQFGRGVISGTQVQLSGTGNASRTPVGPVTVTGTLTFWITTGECAAPYTIHTSGS